ncbi:hypothetical protein WH87_01335 [Devosia epidermidihirudinis]|uniref:Uncharacterized protein n=1 Tax=Devosia epidermidihirudinis TaxID=1293439 RepID=A0A0F5QLD8_9HYPH|nr:hypothetical protein [Devosia epidermidihirudinis]KKC40849.1 hypothetical protein WH87_01335 [Devosia epidermidihirudinis]
MKYKIVAVLLCLGLAPAAAQEESNPKLVSELMAFHGSKAIVSAMTTHCYENTGLDPAYKTANDNWYLRNIGFLDLADRVILRLGGGAEGEKQAAETYGGTQIMSAYNQASDKGAFCRSFLEQIDNGALDIDKQLPSVLSQAQAIAAQ